MLLLPAGFVYLQDIDPTIIQEMRYFTDNNFVGRRIDGYEAGKCILTREAAMALQTVQQRLASSGYGLKVYDCYRPQRAVEDFIRWSADPSDQKMKQEYYPHLQKPDLFTKGYIATRSAHTRGSTVDLTIVSIKIPGSPKEIEMGTHFDYLDELSHPLTFKVAAPFRANRLMLRKVMQQAGFLPYDKEWWHFTLGNEPFPDTWFDFPVA